MAVGALERDQASALSHRHHRESAALTLASAVGKKVAQVPADLLENDAFCCSVPYTCPDRRAFRVRLTRAGDEAFAKMARAHEEWIVSVLSGLSRKEHAELFRLLAKVKSHALETTERKDGA